MRLRRLPYGRICHMPKLLRNAISVGPWEADDPSHLIKINTDPTAQMYTDAWAAGNVKGIHSLGKQ